MFDWDAAIEHYTKELKRLCAMLFAMAGWEAPVAGRAAAVPKIMDKFLHSAVSKLLRKGESAARRLVTIIMLRMEKRIALERAEREAKAVAQRPTSPLRGSAGRARPVTRPEGRAEALPKAIRAGVNDGGKDHPHPALSRFARQSPSRAGHGPRPSCGPPQGGGGKAAAVSSLHRKDADVPRSAEPTLSLGFPGSKPLIAPVKTVPYRPPYLPPCRKPEPEPKPESEPRQSLAFPLFDPRASFSEPGPKRVPDWRAPRIWFLGEDMPALPKKPAPPDPEAWPATNLFRRLAAFSRLLDDLPRHAARLVRWRARRAAQTGRYGFTAPMRGGHAPGRQKGGRHEADSILHDCHMHALHAYDHPGELTPDTS